jgi:Family of unknown function (DUF6440)
MGRKDGKAQQIQNDSKDDKTLYDSELAFKESGVGILCLLGASDPMLVPLYCLFNDYGSNNHHTD